MKTRTWVISAAVLLLSGALAWSYVLLGSKWNTSQIVMHLELGSGGALIDGSASWDDVAQTALGIWNQWIADTQFVGVGDAPNSPGDGDRMNDVFFDSTIYGYNFGDAVAVTTIWTINSGKVRVEGDTIFNVTLPWNSYRGSLRRTSGGGTLYDLRRVAIHEFGHTLGLDHPDEHGQSVVAIMNSRVSDLDTVQPDDVRGAQALYGVGAAGPVLDVPVDSRAKFLAPAAPRLNTTAGRYRFRGTADPRFVKAVYLTNSRIGVRRYLPVNGLQRWSRLIALQPGRNAIRLFIDPGDGSRQLVATRVIRRMIP